MFSVKHIVRYALGFEHIRKELGFLDGDCADQNWLTLSIAVFDLSDYGLKLSHLADIDQIIKIVPDHGLIGRYHRYF